MATLEAYQEKLGKVSQQVKLNFSKMRKYDEDLDGQICEAQNKLLECENKFYNSGVSDQEKTIVQQTYKSELEKIKEAAIQKGHYKVHLAQDTYKIVDDQIKEIDEQLRQLQSLIQSKVKKQREQDMDIGKRKRGQYGKQFVQETPHKDGRGRKPRNRGRGSSKQQSLEDEAQIFYETAVDHNVPVYCICQKPQFGEMIACDNNDCEVEWFHFSCVGIKEQPDGQWYCDDCTKKMARQ